MNKFGRKGYTLEEAVRRMERYCAYQERSHREVKEKLREMRMIPQAIDEILVHLITHDFLNEGRFTSSFIRGKFNQKGWGKDRLRRELKFRNIESRLIEKTLEQEISQEEYLEKLQSLGRKRWEALAGESPVKRKQKFVNYLLYRGWESEKVFGLLKSLEEGVNKPGI